ncbi:MAG TPA: SDR family NAD(P)-dependent oxidoreductase [Solirubrobacteraceae bacterium]|nr:SDR family NAD(P)-dependent oxidoreductase [Solirubrobacteraceae bacterium]
MKRLPASLRPRRGAPPIAGQRVLITGGSSGIGLACAHALSARGARVVLLARGEDGLKRAAAGMAPAPPTVSADVSDVEALRSAVDRAAERLGGLDAVVANAAAAAVGPFAQMTADDIHRTIDSALLGMLNTTHVALPHLERSRGRLVVVGSIAGRVPVPWLSAYTAAKHGVRGFVRTLAIELRALGSPVAVALVAPGPVDTPFWRRARSADGRLAPRVYGAYRPQDVAADVVRAFGSPRTERTVGGLMAAVALIDAIAPNVAVRVSAPVAALAWRRRERHAREPADALTQPVGAPRMHEGLPSRPSVAVKLRDLAGVGRR